jgi:hypothetical protein
MIYIKIGKHNVDEVPIHIQVSGIEHTISENEIQEPDFLFNDAEEYYAWAAENVDGWGVIDQQ